MPQPVTSGELGDLPLPPGSRYLLTGGGTGGHVYPAIAIADEVRRRDPTAQFLYVGVRGKSEARIVPRRGYPLTFVRSAGWPGASKPLQLLTFALQLGLGVLKSVGILLTYRPRLIIGTGGYVSAPILLAAILLRRVGLFSGRTFVHEQNTAPGRLNLLVGANVDKVGVSFAETLKFFPRKGGFVGYPIRREIGHIDRNEARGKLGVPAGRKVVFVFGGSQGARTINRALVEALPELKARGDLFVVHGTGTYQGADYDAVRDTEARLQAQGIAADPTFYLRQDYFHDIEQVYAAADLVVCRGGAGALTELAARALPAIVIPKANLPGDHQVKNARGLARAGAATVLYERVDLTDRGLEERVTGQELAAAVCALIDDPARLATMRASAERFFRPDALGRIGDALAELLEPGRKRAPRALDDVSADTTGPDFEAMGGAALVTWLERRERQSPGPLDPGDLAYLQARCDGLLASPAWQTRNHGVKLVGLLGYTARLPHLLYLQRQKKPVGLFQRLLGGDFVQVGFIRRNLFVSLGKLGVTSPDVWQGILDGLHDGYFEARSQACAAAARLGRKAQAEGSGAPAEVVARLRELVRDDRNLEVLWCAARALGAVGPDASVLADFERYVYHANWKVRQAIVEALGLLLERGVVEPQAVAAFADRMLITSYGFQPHFPLKAELRKLGAGLASARQAQERP